MIQLKNNSEGKQSNRSWQCSNQTTKQFHTIKTELVTDDTAALKKKINSVITQKDAYDFWSIDAGQISHKLRHSTHNRVATAEKKIKLQNSQVSPQLVHTYINQTKKFANTIKARMKLQIYDKMHNLG